MTVIPSGWDWITLTDIAQNGVFTDGDWIESKDQDPAGDVRLTQLADVGVGLFRDRSDRWLREDQAARLGCTFLEPNDVLVARMPDPIGRACLVPENIGRAVTAVDVAILRLDEASINPRYVMWAINTPRFRREVLGLQSGTTRKRISRRNLATLSIPVPPLDEQHRIVEALESHLSRLDAGEEALDVNWQRTRAMRASVMNWTLNGLEGQRTTLGEVCTLRNGIFVSRAKDVPIGVPILRIGAVRPLNLDLTDIRYSERHEPELKAEGSLLEPGDLVFTRYNGNPNFVGACAVVPPETGPLTYPDKLIRAKVHVAGVVPEYLAIACSVGPARVQIRSFVKTTSGQAGVSGRDLKSVELLLPSVNDQTRALQHINEKVDAVDRLAGSITTARGRSEGIRASLLAAAFSGQLTGRSSDMEKVEEMAGV